MNSTLRMENPMKMHQGLYKLLCSLNSFRQRLPGAAWSAAD